MKKFYVLLFLFIAVYMLPSRADADLSDLKTKQIKVDISGEVQQQKTLLLPAGSSIDDALNLVELNEDADLSMVNRQTVLKDGDSIVIQKKREDQLVSLNFSDSIQLQTLPGIGPAISQRIIDYRNTYGLFQQIEDIKNVKGIGDKTFEKIKELICL